MLRNVTVSPDNTHSSVVSRMSKFLHYIEEHYQQEITIQQLASSANVNQAEVFRCFKKRCKQRLINM